MAHEVLYVAASVSQRSSNAILREPVRNVVTHSLYGDFRTPRSKSEQFMCGARASYAENTVPSFKSNATIQIGSPVGT
jgi:hypothetical protein